MLKILTNNIKEVGYDIKDEAKLSAIFGIGNGYFGIRGSFEEFGDVFVQGCYIRGAFDEIIEIPATFADNIYMKKYYFDVQKLKTFEYQDSCINLFDPTTIKIYVNGKMFLPWEGKIIKWERYIDFKTGGLIRKVIWDDGKGNQSEFHFERYCSFANNHLFFQKVSITKLNHNLDMVIDMGIDTLVKTNGQHKSKIVYINNTKDNVDLIANLGHKYNMNVALSSKNFVNNCEFIKTLENNKVYSSAYMMKSKSAELFKVVCVYLNIDGVEDILSSCKNDLEGISYQNIYLNHIKAYKKSFDKINVKIEGNNKINILLKYANYQTLIGFDRYDSIHSLSAKNLTAEKYNQFVWVPVKDINSMSQCMIADGECDLQLQSDGTLKCVTHESSNIVGKLWVTSVGGSFGDENNSYNANDGLREPAIVTDNNMGTGTGYDGKNYEEAGYTSASNMLEDFKKQYKIMSASVAKNGGFYIGRYEMSLSTANSDSPGTNGKPSSKAGVMPTSAENSATSMWYGLYRTAKTYTVEEDSVVSSMVWGSQYDAMLNWVKNGNGLDASKVTDNSGIGNNGTSTVSTTGNSVYSDDKINNIRDLAGNLYEWTLEAYSTSYRIIRGR